MLNKMKVKGMEFSDKDVLNWDDFEPRTRKEHNGKKPFLIYNEYGTLCIVFADNEQDALDEAADRDAMKGHKINPEDKDYDAEKGTYNGEGVTYLGNASEPYDLTNIGTVELPTPRMSLTGLYLAANTLEIESIFEKHKAGYLLTLISNHYTTDFPTPDQCVWYLEKRPDDTARFPGLLPDLKKID